MFFDPKCVPCIINQAYEAAKLFAQDNREIQLKVVKEASRAVESIDMNYTAPLFSVKIQSIIESNLGLENPYKKLKEKNLKNAESYLRVMDYVFEQASDKLEAAINIAILGNTIDLGANPNFNLNEEIRKFLSEPIMLTDINKFRKDLYSAKKILYIGDNYEEALFDKYLLKILSDKDLVFAVRSHPVLNDITLEDAKNLGIDNICKVIESGSKIAGTDLRNCSPEFLQLYKDADMVIAKGQGNYETLLDEKRSIYFLFKVKCDVIAARAGLPVGQSVLSYKG